MSESWKNKHIDDWSSEELQTWVQGIKLGSKNQKKLVNAIRDSEICGEDFNSMVGKQDIKDSFPDINAMSVNRIFAALKNVRQYNGGKKKGKPKKKKSDAEKYNPKKYSKDPEPKKSYPIQPKQKQASSTWKRKYIDNWSCQELQDWMGSIGLNPKDERRMTEAIDMQGIEGEDFNSMDTASDICDSFDGLDNNMGNKIFAELVKVRRLGRRNSNDKSWKKNNNGNFDNDNDEYLDEPYVDNGDVYTDQPFDMQAEIAKNEAAMGNYVDDPYSKPKNYHQKKPQQNYGGYGNNNNNNRSVTPYVNPNSIQHKINRIKQEYPELDADTIREVLGRHNNNLQETLKFIAMRKRQMNQEDNEQKRQKEVEELADLFGSLISLAVVEEAGFVLAKPENRVEVVRRLTRVEPSGLTALRDAVVIGIAHMLKVKVALAKIGSLKHRFIHIVLTDGEDTASEQTLNELKGFFLKLGRELGDMCTTYFIGVGLDEEEKDELEGIARIGGKSCELFNCDDVRIGDVFKRIAISLGIKQEIIAIQHQGQIVAAAAQEHLEVQITEQKFLVLFTLDISASMLDGRWDKVVAAVAGFMTGLKPTDIVGAILFNERCVIITDQ